VWFVQATGTSHQASALLSDCLCVARSLNRAAGEDLSCEMSAVSEGDVADVLADLIAGVESAAVHDDPE
jgi:hypothetical protein